MDIQDLLIEIGTEELPPKALQNLSKVFCQKIVEGLKEAGVEQGAFTPYATPRRLAVLIKDVAENQADQNIERKGPHIKAAYQADGSASKAALGFARSCAVNMADITTTQTSKGEYLFYQATAKGAPTASLLQIIIENALKQLPIPKRMRWGEKTVEFVRPVHWLIVRHGYKVIPCTVLGIDAGSDSMGHRFHYPKRATIRALADYEKQLEKAYVMVSFEKRKSIIIEQATNIAKKLNAEAIIDADVLNEVTGLVEWPVAIVGKFEEKFLDVPPEVLIKTMQDNQKYFPLKDKNGRLINKFITISNIESVDVQQVIQGNERVIRPRLADAEFFWNTDRKQSLAHYSEGLKKLVFQKQLGTVFDKSLRIEKLALIIGKQINANAKHIKSASALCKNDLMSSMVGEFASLQGVIGQYYAKADGLDNDIADAIFEHYLPRFAGDILPKTKTGQAIAIADKLDTLCGIFSIGQKPTGMKDPFALRRASLGILRIIIEAGLSLDLKQLINNALKALPVKPVENAEKDILDYIYDRLKNYYLEQGVDAKTVISVLKVKPTQPLDFDKRIQAVTAFMKTDSAKSLAAANKRIGNLLKKQSQNQTNVDEGLLTEPEEKQLYHAIQKIIKQNANSQDYQSILINLSSLQKEVDAFFENVMVMVDDETIKNNRLALLNALSSQFMQVADISGLG